jgi:hypothetical protein
VVPNAYARVARKIAAASHSFFVHFAQYY